MKGIDNDNTYFSMSGIGLTSDGPYHSGQGITITFRSHSDIGQVINLIYFSEEFKFFFRELFFIKEKALPDRFWRKLF
jgi:hypothetical protein